jgi:hypothetical protein
MCTSIFIDIEYRIYGLNFIKFLIQIEFAIPEIDKTALKNFYFLDGM